MQNDKEILPELVSSMRKLTAVCKEQEVTLTQTRIQLHIVVLAQFIQAIILFLFKYYGY